MSETTLAPTQTGTIPRAGLQYPWPAAPATGHTIEIRPGVHWMRLPLPMALDHVNAYALDDGDGWTVVDPGIDTPACRAALQAVLDGPLAAKPVTRVVVTHYHPDHIGLAGWLQAKGASLWTTRTSWLQARMLQLDAQDRPAPETLAFWRAAGMDATIYDTRQNERPFNFADCVHPLPLGYRRVVAGQWLKMGGRDWVVRIGHGHAPEHATFWSDDLVLGGDQLLPSISANLGVYASEPDADPVQDWIDSARAMQPFASDAQLILPGHKLPFTGLPLRLNQMIENHSGALRRLRAHLETGAKTACDCFPPLFKRQIDAGTYGLALVEAVAHLNHLWHREEVRRDIQRETGVWYWSLR
ncbi:MBL fold hydrolase [Thioclava sp. SK-1]|uniref:MBL fold metallo-hydrolase n=1 Tax=Thioclava sp. SK-1 TaxID=1889770 RepID=UPI000825B62C|nr:MBL fold metallo-hydrolase [Thioclava sp. SK-1]OCX66891.1 MBL fold hydrolase [Thioclava sp. SK-1]